MKTMLMEVLHSREMKKEIVCEAAFQILRGECTGSSHSEDKLWGNSSSVSAMPSSPQMTWKALGQQVGRRDLPVDIEQ